MKISIALLGLLVAGVTFAAPPAAAPAPAAGAPKVLRLYIWSNYLVDELVKSFEEANKVKVEVTTFESNEELVTALLVSPKPPWDVVFPSAEYVPVLARAGKLEKLDKAKLPNLSNLHPQFRKLPFDPAEELCVPYLWGTLGIAYNSKFIKEVDSWGVLWDPKYKGKIVLMDEMRDTMGAALAYGGYSVNATGDAELAKAEELLLKQKPLVLQYSSEKAAEALKSGKAWLSNLWGGDVMRLAQQKPEIRYVVPKEGGGLFLDTMCATKGGPAKELAHAFINFILEAKSGALLSSKLRYATPNKAALALVDPKVLRDPFVYPSWADMARLEFQNDLGKDAVAKWAKVWKTVRK